MYSNYPNATDVQMQTANEMGSVKAVLSHNTANVPGKCEDFLLKLGWSHHMSHPDTSERLYHKPPPNEATEDEKKAWNYDLQYAYWHWYEAMAYEFGKFMGIDTDTGGEVGQSSGQAQTAAPFHGNI